LWRFGASGASRIAAAAGPRCAVGFVAFDIAALTPAAAYKAKFDT
jgi:hypothetical protein